VASIDDKVVSMSFETSKFQQGVATVLSGLDKLKAALQFPNAGKGLDEVNAAAKKTDLSHIGKAIDDIKNKFSAMSIVALSVLSNIVNKAVSAGGRLLKALTLDPLIDGFKEYELGINSVQTILGNTAAAGVKLKDVERSLNQLNQYADKTIYNFGEMTKNVGTFTAAGVDLKTSVSSIKGIANMAALSGANSAQASTAMYQLSQAISSGKVALQDWKSVENASMGSATFKRALAETAVHMGTLKENAVKMEGPMKNVSINGESFRQSISADAGGKSWLTSGVLTQTLKQLSGDMTDAQLKAEGYSAAQIKSIQATAKLALESATQVKTLSALLSTTKEQIGTGWADTWKIVFGDFTEAKTLFTGISAAIGGFVSSSADARNKVLGDWKALGGRTALIEAIKNVFEGLASVVKPVKEAFRDIFPATTGKNLYDLTVRFKEFTETLKMGPDTAENLKRTFRGLFALLDIGKQVVSGIFRVFARMFGVIAGGSGDFLNITGSIGDFLVSVDQALKKGTGLTKFFDGLGTVLSIPLQLFKLLGQAVSSLFDAFGGKASGGLSKSLGEITESMSPMQKAISKASGAWKEFLQMLDRVKTQLQPIVDTIGNVFGGIMDALKSAFSQANIDSTMAVLQTGLLGGIVVMIKKFISGGWADNLSGGIMSSIAGSFDAITGSLQAMQTNIKADTIKKIAISIGILTASVVALSFIDQENLTKALSAMTIGFGQLLGAMAILTNVSKSAGFLKVPFIAASLILLASAVTVLTLAVTILSRLSWEELAKGLSGVGVLLIMISKAVVPLSKGSAGMISAGIGILAIAAAMKILASAVKDFGAMSWSEIGKGLASVAAALVGIGLASKIFPSGMVSIGVGLIAVSLGLKLLASAVGTFGSMNWGGIVKGMVGVAGSLLIIAGAMAIMPPNMVVTAAGLVLVSIALKGIAAAIGDFGGMSVGELAKGIGALAITLTLLAAALIFMTGSLSGAAALAVAAVGLNLLSIAMERLGGMSWGSILKGLVALAAAMALVGVAAYLLTPAIPAMLGLGVAMLAIGAALALAGAGIFLVGAGLSAIAVAGPAAILVLVKALESFAMAIPKFVLGVVMGLLSIVDRIAEVAPKFVTAFVAILSTILEAVIIVAPKLEKAITVLLQSALNIIEANMPRMIEVGFRLLTALLTGIRNNIGQVVTQVAQIIITILNSLAARLPQITRAGAELLVSLLQGIADNIRSVVSAATDVVVNFARGIGNNVGRAANAAGDMMAHLLAAIVGYYARMTTTGAKLIIELIDGIASKFGAIAGAGKDAIMRAINAVSAAAVGMTREGADAIIHFVNGMASAVRDKAPAMRAAGANLASAIIGGVLGGLNGGAIVNKMVSIAGGALAAAKRKLKSHSPSKEFIKVGEAIIDGWVIGLENNSDQIITSMEDMVDGIISTVATIPDAVGNMMDLNPVIAPVLDLTGVQQGAQAMGSMLNVVPITAAASYGQASAISASQNTVQSDLDASVAAPGSTVVNLEQNNYSPKALSEAEIYRQTKNQLSTAKAALA